MTGSGASSTVTVSRGNIHIPAAVYETYFAGLNAVILLRREADLLILPVRQAAAGGFLLKLRNSAGDRVIPAADFLRDNGIEDSDTCIWTLTWSTEAAGLFAPGVFVNEVVSSQN
jgi:hypothetical protein